MAFAVTDFKSNMSKVGGGARPSLYEIDINGKDASMSFSSNMNILCKAASIPASTIAPLAVNYAGRAYKWNGFRTFDNWTVTIINDEDFGARNMMSQWMRYISGKFDGTRSAIYGDQLVGTQWYDGDATVTQIGTDGAAKSKYKFHYLWPTEIAGIPVDWSIDAVQEYTVTFAYDYWTHVS